MTIDSYGWTGRRPTYPRGQFHWATRLFAIDIGPDAYANAYTIRVAGWPRPNIEIGDLRFRHFKVWMWVTALQVSQQAF